MALIKKYTLEKIYGVEEKSPLELVVVQPFEPEQITTNGNGHHDIEQDAQALIQERADQLLEIKELEIAREKEAVLNQIDQELEEARIEAAAIVSEARQEAETQKAKIQVQYQELEKQKQEQEAVIAHEREKAFDEAMTRADEYIAEFMQILATFSDFKKEVLSEAKEDIAALALDVVRKILAHEATINPQLLEQQVKNAINKVSVSSGLLQIYLNPEDLESSKYLESVLAKVLDKNVKLHFEADETVDIGSCIINTQGGRLDASFASQLELIRVAFERYLGHKIIELPEPVIEEEDMEIDPTKLTKALAQTVDEPSDDELAMMDELDLADFELDDDMDALLQDVLKSDADVKDDSSVKIDDDIPLAKAEAVDDLNLDDAVALFANDDADEDLDDEDGVEFEEFNEFAEDPDLDDDSNFDGSSSDERFPEY